MIRRTAIEMMVDQACGFDPNAPTPPRPKCKATKKHLVLRCLRCSDETMAKREPRDPKKADLAICICPRCLKKGEHDVISYFDKDGKELPVP